MKGCMFFYLPEFLSGCHNWSSDKLIFHASTSTGLVWVVVPLYLLILRLI